MAEFTSWGHIQQAQHFIYPLVSRFDSLPPGVDGKLLAYGMGRSYGDVCLNDENVLMPTRRLDKFIKLDPAAGTIRCEAGVCLSDLLALIIPHGYFIPVTPGTKYVSIGGMIANDVHGKNHHKAGSFGCHVTALTCLRSEDGPVICSPEHNAGLFNATIGGLGLTGLITEVEIQLKRISSVNIEQETIPFASIDEFIQITHDSDSAWEYTVAWIDSLADTAKLGRGIYFRGNHSETDADLTVSSGKQALKVPFYLPNGLLNPMLLKYFNKLYFNQNKKGSKTVHYEPFFYPLDGVGMWNRIYGKRGFYQYQCVVPAENAADVLKALLGVCTKYQMGSFLSVLKKFGKIQSPGMLSFPREGYTLALDFPNSGNKVRQMMDELDSIVLSVNGAVYPAKDARMDGAAFKRYFPNWQQFADFIDPRFSSSFWRRMMMEN